MRLTRIVIVVALLAVIVIAGVLSTPWVQVVEENTRKEEIAFTRTYTYTHPYTSTVVETTALTMSTTTVSQLSGIVMLGTWSTWNGWASDFFELRKGQTVKFEVRVTPLPTARAPDVSGGLYRVVYVQGLETYTPVCDFFVLPSGELFSDPLGTWTFDGNKIILGECTAPETSILYRVGLVNLEHFDVHVDLKVLSEEVTWTTVSLFSTIVSTRYSAVTQTSTSITTWYNTTYKRPLG